MAIIGEVIPDYTGVIMQEVHGFTDFGDGITEGFTRLTHQYSHQRLHLIFHQLSGAD